jgi:hypothetical protein
VSISAINARNQIKGIIKHINLGDIVSEIELDTPVGVVIWSSPAVLCAVWASKLAKRPLLWSRRPKLPWQSHKARIKFHYNGFSEAQMAASHFKAEKF